MSPSGVVAATSTSLSSRLPQIVANRMVRGSLQQARPPAHPPGVISHHCFRSTDFTLDRRPVIAGDARYAFNLKMQFPVSERQAVQGGTSLKLMENCDVHLSTRSVEAAKPLSGLVADNENPLSHISC
ncbi:hypothetical protein [Rhizobium sp. Leaf371]|uniref:hypothetical protein n=1 Tax=Rhizobium sp. Leaf371 TaxID=1736355 RepID=UPI00138F4834|nr:hypothetical protein [Rhizobium sp. Leaf371]